MAIYPTDATYSTALMVNRKPDRGFSVDYSFPAPIIFESDAGYEKRQLTSRRASRVFKLNYGALDNDHRLAIENFYLARSGEYESFTFDLTHIGETGTAVVRFSGSLDKKHLFSTNNATENYYSISIELKEVY